MNLPLLQLLLRGVLIQRVLESHCPGWVDVDDVALLLQG
jgi:hypothetical protein